MVAAAVAQMLLLRLLLLRQMPLAVVEGTPVAPAAAQSASRVAAGAAFTARI